MGRNLELARHGDDFAARLRDLKDRSGRSYGALAQRLHTSTSTLHRYCNGTTVPAEFGPVERFARACGASPDEVLAVHRLWLLADAERRAETSGGSGSGASSGSGSDAGSDTGSSTSAGTNSSTDSGTERDTTAVVEPAARKLPEPPKPSEPEVVASESEPDGSSDTTALEPVVISPAGPHEETEADGGDKSRWRKPALVGTLAAAAILVPLALYSTNDSGTHSADTNHLVSSSATPTASSAKSTVSSTSSAASTSPTSPASPAAGATSSTSDPQPDPPPAPFTVTVLSDNWDTECGQWFYATQPPSKVPQPPGLSDVPLWAGPLNAAPADHLRLQLTAQGTAGKQQVVLNTMFVHIVSAKPAPKAGYGYAMGSGCGGGLDPASFDVNLDAAAPKIKAVKGEKQDNNVGIIDFPFQVSSTDSQIINVDAHSTDQDITWYLEVVWNNGGHQERLRVDDNGKPFHTIGLSGKPLYFYNGTKWAPTELF